MITFATIRFTIDGIHNYPTIQEGHTYLKHPHRHVFYFEVSVQQFHNNRDIEYLAFKAQLLKNVKAQYNTYTGVDDLVDFGSSSCEDIAFVVLQEVNKLYPEMPKRVVQISVFEDNENGCVIK